MDLLSYSRYFVTWPTRNKSGVNRLLLERFLPQLRRKHEFPLRYDWLFLIVLSNCDWTLKYL